MIRCGLILCLLFGVVRRTEAQWQSIGTDRGSVDVYVPENSSGKQLPLAIGLHAYSNSGLILESTMQMQSVAEDRQVILCYPNGTLGFLFLRFWNATFACCGPTTGVDDSGYLRALIEQLQATFEIDPQHIHLFGYSNGGFMANRMACDHSDVVASVASFAGGSWLDPANCPADEPVSVLLVHGTEDAVIQYTGGTLPLIPGVGPYPSHEQSVEHWKFLHACEDAPRIESTIDLHESLDGEETVVRKYGDCRSEVAVESWSVQGLGHLPVWSNFNLSEALMDWLLAHPKPPLCDCTGDVNTDCQVNFEDLTILLSGWSGNGRADVNGDGVCDFEDLLTVLSAFGSPCG